MSWETCSSNNSFDSDKTYCEEVEKKVRTIKNKNSKLEIEKLKKFRRSNIKSPFKSKNSSNCKINSTKETTKTLQECVLKVRNHLEKVNVLSIKETNNLIHKINNIYAHDVQNKAMRVKLLSQLSSILEEMVTIEDQFSSLNIRSDDSQNLLPTSEEISSYNYKQTVNFTINEEMITNSNLNYGEQNTDQINTMSDLISPTPTQFLIDKDKNENNNEIIIPESTSFDQTNSLSKELTFSNVENYDNPQNNTYSTPSQHNNINSSQLSSSFPISLLTNNFFETPNENSNNYCENEGNNLENGENIFLKRPSESNSFTSPILKKKINYGTQNKKKFLPIENNSQLIPLPSNEELQSVSQIEIENTEGKLRANTVDFTFDEGLEWQSLKTVVKEIDKFKEELGQWLVEKAMEKHSEKRPELNTTQTSSHNSTDIQEINFELQEEEKLQNNAKINEISLFYKQKLKVEEFIKWEETSDKDFCINFDEINKKYLQE